MIGCAQQETPVDKKANQQKEELEKATKPPTEQPHIEGTITKLEEGKFIVEENPDEPEVTEKAEVSLEKETRYWIPKGDKYQEGDQADLKQGMKVKVWYTGIIVDSYPVQSKGAHIVYEK